MDVIVLGLGMQGRAAVYDLVKFGAFEHIVAVDSLQNSVDWVKEKFDDPRVIALKMDVNNESALSELLHKYAPGVVIDLLPIEYIPRVSAAAIESGWHFVNTYYTRDIQRKLHSEAVSRGLTILPEFGLDPGIDLVMAGDGISRLDKVLEYFSFGAGIPEPAACNNPLNYKISWIFDGVLNLYYSAARIVSDGKFITIPRDEIFNEKWLRMRHVDRVGTLECYPNGDITGYLELAGVRALRNGGRYSMRYPGHHQFWYVMAKMGLLEDKTVRIDGHECSQRRIIAQLLEPHLQYSDDERDMVILRVELKGEKDGQEVERVYEMIDYRDLDTGFFAMSRTVGFVASVGAQMIQSGVIHKRGVCTPMFDVPYEPFLEELDRRGLSIKHSTVT
ncbi:MAG: saccharopine dehydrogenase NADP-binding domain-containing protein [candidate division WOR-3 bacterium]|nr:MAG: saccharopine dehydrogenase NADP-binding domain-containing protein [candidate division WOR-3 bacterium]